MASYAGTPFSGVFKSTDRGESWTALTTRLNDNSVDALAIDPSRPATIYAGTSDHIWASGGVIKSVNGGESWGRPNRAAVDALEDARIAGFEGSIASAKTLSLRRLPVQCTPVGALEHAAREIPGEGAGVEPGRVGRIDGERVDQNPVERAG